MHLGGRGSADTHAGAVWHEFAQVFEGRCHPLSESDERFVSELAESEQEYWGYWEINNSSDKWVELAAVAFPEGKDIAVVWSDVGEAWYYVGGANWWW